LCPDASPRLAHRILPFARLARVECETCLQGVCGGFDFNECDHAGKYTAYGVAAEAF
jgi:hypothetical protein